MIKIRKYRSIVIDGYEVDLYAIKSKELKPELVTKDGLKVIKETLDQSHKAVYKFVVDNKEIAEKEVCFKLGNIILRQKPRFSTLIKNYVECSSIEVMDLVVNSYYLADCQKLLEKLKKSKKALKFPFSWGNGFAIYTAYLRVVAEEFLVLYLAFPNMKFIPAIMEMSRNLNTATKEIKEDNSTIQELINQQAEMLKSTA